MRFWMDLGRLLERFWVDFGSKLGGKLRPSWHQNPTKSDTKTIATKQHPKRRSPSHASNFRKLWEASWGPLRVLENGVPEALGPCGATHKRHTPQRSRPGGGYTILYYTLLYYTLLYAILYYTILYYILYYTILYYTILYYTIYTILYTTYIYTRQIVL